MTQTNHDSITDAAAEELYRLQGDNLHLGVKIIPHEGPGRPSYAYCVEYAVKIADLNVSPAAPTVERSSVNYLHAWLDFDRHGFTEGILPQGPMSCIVSAPLLEIREVAVPLPVYAFAYDAETPVVRYNPELVVNLDLDDLANMLFLTMEQYVDPDDYDDHHDLERDRQEVLDRARVIAEAIVNDAPSQGFVTLLARHVDQFHTTLPWPQSPMEVTAKNGAISITVNPR